MAISQEAKDRIYEEEKARLEAQERLKKENLTSKELVDGIFAVLTLLAMAWFLYQFFIAK